MMNLISIRNRMGASNIARLGQFQQLLKTRVILILNFTRIHCDYLLITQGAKLLNFWMLETATTVGRGHPSRTLQNFLASFFHSPIFWKRSFITPCYCSCFHFRSCILIVRFIPRQLSETRRHCYRKTTARLNKKLLSNLRTIRERVILPSSRSKIK